MGDNHPISKRELEIYLSFYEIDFINTVYPYEGAFQSVSRKIAMRFRDDPQALLQNLAVLVNKPYAQLFFVEHFPDYDNLCAYYYQVFEEYLKQKKIPSAIIYGNCMLFLKAFWEKDAKASSAYLKKINKQSCDATLHPYLIGRYFACNLLYDVFLGNSERLDELYANYLEVRELLPKSGKYFTDFPASEYIFTEALLYCKEYEKCIHLLKRCTEEYQPKMEFTRKGYYRQMQLFWLIAKQKMDKSFDALPYLEKIRPENFYFISKEYYSAFYYYAKGTESDKLKAQEIASDIGNQRLVDYFD